METAQDCHHSRAHRMYSQGSVGLLRRGYACVHTNRSGSVCRTVSWLNSGVKFFDPTGWRTKRAPTVHTGCDGYVVHDTMPQAHVSVYISLRIQLSLSKPVLPLSILSFPSSPLFLWLSSPNPGIYSPTYIPLFI